MKFDCITIVECTPVASPCVAFISEKNYILNSHTHEKKKWLENYSFDLLNSLAFSDLSKLERNNMKDSNHR